MLLKIRLLGSRSEPEPPVHVKVVLVYFGLVYPAPGGITFAYCLLRQIGKHVRAFQISVRCCLFLFIRNSISRIQSRIFPIFFQRSFVCRNYRLISAFLRGLQSGNKALLSFVALPAPVVISTSNLVNYSSCRIRLVASPGRAPVRPVLLFLIVLPGILVCFGAVRSGSGKDGNDFSLHPLALFGIIFKAELILKPFYSFTVSLKIVVLLVFHLRLCRLHHLLTILVKSLLIRHVGQPFDIMYPGNVRRFKRPLPSATGQIRR